MKYVFESAAAGVVSKFGLPVTETFAPFVLTLVVGEIAAPATAGPVAPQLLHPAGAASVPVTVTLPDTVVLP